MKVAVLPFNSAEGIRPELGRQFAAFTAEQVRSNSDAEVNSVSFMTQVQEPDGAVRTAMINMGDELMPLEQIKDLFQQAQVELVQDGVVRPKDDGYDLHIRYFGPDSDEPISEHHLAFSTEEVFANLHELAKLLAEHAGTTLTGPIAGDKMPFGTENALAFIDFLSGFDGLSVINQANGLVTSVFNAQIYYDWLLNAIALDPTFDAPYQVLVQLVRACAQYQIGSFEAAEATMRKAIELRPNDWGGYFALGELHQATGSANTASDLFEKAVQLNPNDPGLLSRLAMVQLQLGMPVNAERNLRKALDLEGDDKPSADMLSMVLQQTGRGHEVITLWKNLVDANPQNSSARAKYAASLLQAGREEEGVRAFEEGLEHLEDNTWVKRFYAPYLAQKGDLDRSMDFYEDVLDVAPNDVQVLTEYAQTLEAAGREFEVPRVLKDILASNPDQNVRAQVLARLIELEQPKRAESVEAAREKMEQSDFASAISQLKPLRNWLADYWKMWALLASAYNNSGQYAEAEEAAQRLLELYPGCEPAYGEYVAALTGQGRTEDAYNFMRYAAGQIQGSLSIGINLALAARRSGRTEEARALAKQIREAVGPNEELEPVLAEIES